jgi:hypothetical protein
MAAGRSRDQAVFACLSCVVMLSLQRRAGQTDEGESRSKMLRLVAQRWGELSPLVKGITLDMCNIWTGINLQK